MTPAELSLERVSKRFGRVVVAENLELIFGSGETIGIVGPNGAGKTTLFSVISGDIEPDNGTVRIGERDVTALPGHRRTRMGLGRTYQVPRPFEKMTVFENALVATHQGAGLSGSKARDTAFEALEQVGLAGYVNIYAGRLALLNRKRLELARAVATRPRILLLDEIAGGLTEPEVDELITLVQSLREQRLTIVWIEHVVNALTKTVDRMLCLAGGAIVADGAPREVLADPTVRELYLGQGPQAEPGREVGT